MHTSPTHADSGSRPVSRARQWWAALLVAVLAVGGAVAGPQAAIAAESEPVAPAITTQPVDVTVTAGDDAVLSIEVTGVPEPTVQWQRQGWGWQPVGTGAQLTLAEVPEAWHGAKFRAVASSESGEVISNIITLTVNRAPSAREVSVVSATTADGLTIQVAGPVYESQSAFWLSVIDRDRASDRANLMGTPVSVGQVDDDTAGDFPVSDGQFTAQWTVPADAGFEAGHRYEVIVWGNRTEPHFGTLERITISLTEAELQALTAQPEPEPVAPAITTQPSAVTVEAGQDAVFTAAASGTPEPMVQWQSRPAGASGWAPVAGATSPTLTLPGVGLELDGTDYRAVFTNSAGSVTSRLARLAVTEPVVGDFDFTIADGEATITGFKDGVVGVTELVIPAQVTQGGNSYPVVAIEPAEWPGDFAHQGLTSVTFPDTLVRIGDSAFWGNELTSVTFPAGLREIGGLAFQDNALSSLHLPEGLSYIGGRAFANNDIAGGLILPDSLETLYGSAFTGNGITSVRIPAGWTSIPDWAFDGNAIASVTFPASVTSIGTGAFTQNAFTEVTIPAHITEIGGSAFGNNPLVSVRIEGSGVSIGDGAFSTPSEGPETFEEVVFVGGPPSQVGWGHLRAPGFDPSFANYGRVGTSSLAVSVPTVRYPYAHSWQAGTDDGFASPTWKGYPAEAFDAPAGVPGAVVPRKPSTAPYAFTHAIRTSDVGFSFGPESVAWHGGADITEYIVRLYPKGTTEPAGQITVPADELSNDGRFYGGNNDDYTWFTSLPAGSWTLTLAAVNEVGQSPESAHSNVVQTNGSSGPPGPVDVDFENDPFFDTALHFVHESGSEVWLSPDAQVGGEMRIVGRNWSATACEGTGVTLKLGGRDAYSFAETGNDIWTTIKAGSNGVFDFRKNLPDGSPEMTTPVFRAGPQSIVFLVGNYWPPTTWQECGPPAVSGMGASWFVYFTVAGDEPGGGDRDPDGSVEKTVSYLFDPVPSDHLVREGTFAPRVDATLSTVMPFAVAPGEVVPAQEATLTLSTDAALLREWLDASSASLNLGHVELIVGDGAGIPIQFERTELAGVPTTGTFTQQVAATIPEFTIPADWIPNTLIKLQISARSSGVTLDLGYQRDGTASTIVAVPLSTTGGGYYVPESFEYLYLPVVSAPAAPAVTTQPVSASATVGDTVRLTAAASGTPVPTVRWESSADGGVSWTPIADATTTLLTLYGVTTSLDGTRYRAVFTNSEGEATSDAAVLSVSTATAAPQITTQPVDASVVEGSTATFTVVGSGAPIPVVQWESSTDGLVWVPVAGATSNTLTISDTAVTQSGARYRAVLINSVGSVTSDVATLTVTAAGSGIVDIEYDYDGAKYWVPNKVVVGEPFLIRGEGWLAKDGTQGSAIAIKLDAGGVSVKEAPINPLTGTPFPNATSPNLTIYDIVVADDETGSWSALVEFPTLENSNVDWFAGQTHGINLLTGSIRPGNVDPIRGAAAEFEVIEGSAPPATVPAAPAKPGVTVDGDTVSVSWIVPADGGSVITGYRVTLTPSAGAPVVRSTSADATSVVFTELAVGTYTATVVAVNEVGASEASPVSDQVTVDEGGPVIPQPEDPTVPAAPAKPGVTVNGDTVNVSWIAPADGGKPITGYTVTLTPAAGDPIVKQTDADASTVSFTGVHAGIYTASVVAVNEIGASEAAPASEAVTVEEPVAPQPTVPAAPAAPTVTVDGSTVTVSWVAPADGGSALTGYTVQLAGGATPLVKEVAAGETTVTFTGVPAGTYTASVVAVNTVGASPVSAASDPATVVTPTDSEPEPGTEVAPVPNGQLTNQNRNGVETPEAAVPGTAITVTVPGHAGEQVRVWLHSTPVLLGTVTLDASGQTRVVIPAGTSLGEHRIVVQTLGGELIGWDRIRIGTTSQVGPDGEWLAATGSDGGVLFPGVVGAALLLLLGAAIRSGVAKRRRNMLAGSVR